MWPFRRAPSLPCHDLVEALAGADPEGARAALADKGAEAVAALTEALSLRRTRPEHKAEIARALGELGPSAEAAIDALVEAMNEAYEPAGDEAAEALYLVGEASVPALLRALGQVDRPAGSMAIGVLSRFGKAAALPLVALLERGSAIERQRAAEALGEIGGEAGMARPALERAQAGDPDPLVRREAGRALQRIWG